MRIIFVTVILFFSVSCTWFRHKMQEELTNEYYDYQESLPSIMRDEPDFDSPLPHAEPKPFDINEKVFVVPEGYESIDQYMLEYKYYKNFDDEESQKKATFALEKVRKIRPNYGTDRENKEKRTVFFNTRSLLMDEKLRFDAADGNCPERDPTVKN